MKNGEPQTPGISIYDEFLKQVKSEEDVRTTETKRVILTLIALGMAIFYMIYDSLQIFQTLLSKNNQLTITEYEILYTVTHLIPIFANPFYGIFTDLYSVRNTYLLCFSFTLVGHLVFTIGLYYRFFFIMFLGRIFVGCGYPVTASSYAFLTKWFIKIKDAYAFSILSFAARIGSFFVVYVIPTNYAFNHSQENIAYPMLIPTMILLLYFFAIYILYYYDVLIDREIVKERERIRIRRPRTSIYSSLDFDQSEKVGQFFQIFGLNNLNLFERSYWMLVAATGMILLTIFTFFNRLTDFLIETYDFKEDKAISIAGLAYMGAAIFTPLFGYLVRLYEKRVKFLLLATGCNIVAHFIFAFVENTSLVYFSIFLKAIVFACIPQAHYSCFVIIVPSNRIGRAFGFNAMVEYIFITFGFLVSAVMINSNVVDNMYKYQNVDFFCLLLSIAAFIVYFTLKKLKI